MTKSEKLINGIWADRCASFWLKESMRTATLRDPVDALNDAEVLVRVLKARLDDMMTANI